jgi:peptide/nickel transport system substrate-binding protein
MKVLVVTALVAAVGVGGVGLLPKAAWADKKTNSVIFGTTHEVSQFNPILWGDFGVEEVVSSIVFDALWDPRPDGTWSPNLATKIPTVENGGVSKDGLTWKIELRKGVKWQDGTPFTAADVEFTWQQIMNEKNNVRARVGFDQIKEFKVIDDYHFEYTLSAPFAPMYVVWDINRIIPKHVLSKVPDLNTCEWNTTGTFGTGPFKLVERVPGSHMVFKRNPDYHLGPPKLETVILKFVPDQTVLYTQMKTGEVDFLGIPGIPKERYEEAKKLPNVDIMTTPTAAVEFLLLNCDRPYFKDKRVRQALSMAIDKQKIIKDIYYGLPKATLTYMRADHWAYNNKIKGMYDPKEAGKILDSLGWKVGSDGIRVKNGDKLTFTFSATTGNKDREQTQLIVQKNLKDIGVSAEIKNLTPAVMWGAFFEETQYDMIIIGGPPDLVSDPDFTASSHSKRPRWHYHPGTPEMDKFLEEGLRTLDQAKRKESYARFQEFFVEECFYIPLFSRTDIYSKKKGLSGYKNNPYTEDLTRFIREWYWE